MLLSSFCFSSLDASTVSNKVNVQLIEQIIKSAAIWHMKILLQSVIISGKMSFMLIISGKCIASWQTGIDIWLADRNRSCFSSQCSYSLNIPFLFSPWKGYKSIESVPFRGMQNTLGKDEISSVLTEYQNVACTSLSKNLLKLLGTFMCTRAMHTTTIFINKAYLLQMWSNIKKGTLCTFYMKH